MKHNFMNKRNGKIASVLVMYLDDEGHMQTDGYDKVEDLLEDYAAYEQAKPEPLIKDEKIRNAVRAWAEAVDADSAFVEKWAYDGDQFVLSDELAEIHFRITTPKEIKAYKRYTIAELCGEEGE